MIKKFEDYLNEGIVKKITPDKQRSFSLKEEAIRKHQFLEKQQKLIEIDDENANEFVEISYNIIMLILRSKMLEEGFNSSGQGAHEAEVAFSRTMNLKESEIKLLDQLRYFRNGILYYGKRFDKEYAQKVIIFTEKIIKKIK